MRINIGNDLYLKGRIGWKGLSKDEYLPISDYRIINGYSLKDGYIDWDIAGFISRERYEESPEIKLKVNDILISKDGTIGKVGIVRKLLSPTTVASGIFVLRNIIADKLNTEYLFQYLKSSNFKAFINSVKAEGSTINHLYQRDLIRLELDIPCIHKQSQIAKILFDLDSKIELNNKLNRELEAMAKTLYDYWFVQFNFPNEQGKPYKSSGGKMVYNAELKREIPEGWKVKKLSEIATTGSGGTPLSTKKEYYENGDIPWINSGEVNMPFIVSTKNFITQKGLENSSAKIFKRGTILMAMYGATAGKVSSMDIDASTNQAICAINPEDACYRIYLKLVLENLYKHLINLSSGSARDNLSQDKIRELKFIIPSKSLIQKFDNIAYSSTNTILINLKQNHLLSELRDWLLPMLMNGQIIVKEAEEKMSLAAEPHVEYK